MCVLWSFWGTDKSDRVLISLLVLIETPPYNILTILTLIEWPVYVNVFPTTYHKEYFYDNLHSSSGKSLNKDCVTGN